MIFIVTTRILVTLITFGYKSYSLPFYWNATKGKVELAQSKRRLLAWKCILAVHFAWKLILSTALAAGHIKSRLSAIETIISIIIWTFSGISLIFSSLLLTDTGDWRNAVNFMNDIFMLNSKLAKQHSINSKIQPVVDRMDALMKKLVFMACQAVGSFPVASIFTMELMPDLFRYVRSDYMTLVFIRTAVDTGSFYIDWLFILILISASALALRTSAFWLKRLSWTPSLISQQIQFRYLQLLHMNLVSFAGPLMPVFGAALLVLVTSVLFCGIKMFIKSQAYVAVFFMGASLMSLVCSRYFFAFIWETTQVSMSHKTVYFEDTSTSALYPRKINKTFLRSFAPFKFPQGLVIGRDTFLVFSNLIFQQVITLLLTFRA